MNKSDKQIVIVTQNLSLGYENRAIVSNISINIHKGEFIGILGPNGSGKSTFLRAILGLIKPLNGQMSVLGEKPRHGNTEIGYMPQMRNQISVANLTGRALLEAVFNGTHYGLPIFSEDKKNKIQQVLDMVKASSYADRSFQQLSGGERQRIFLAQALLGNPPILLLDEPLSNLDPHYQEAFINLLYNIQQNLNATILFTAHDPNPLLGVMSRVLFFAKGKTIIGTTDSIITTATLTSLYETPIEVVKINQRLFVLGYGGQNVLGEVVHHD
jgi:zinc/manganese transport system ATP-binding protein